MDHKPKSGFLFFNIEDPEQKREMQDCLNIDGYKLALWDLTIQNDEMERDIRRATLELLQDYKIPKKYHENIITVTSMTIASVTNDLCDRYNLRIE